MKQQVPMPVTIAVAAVVLGGIGFFLWRQFLSPPEEKPFAPTMTRPAQIPKTKEEGMKMYGGGSH
jgi:hypothetical protein